MKLPFSRSYWVEPGRVLAGCYPDEKDPEVAEAKLTGLIECGVSRVINLMEAHEVDHAGNAFASYEPLLESLARQHGRTIKCRRFAIVDLSVPTVTDMARILDWLDEGLAAGKVTYVHCWGGRGRTGTVVACHLRRVRGLSSADALSHLSRLTEHNAAAFWPTPEMPSQHEFVHAWRDNR